MKASERPLPPQGCSIMASSTVEAVKSSCSYMTGIIPKFAKPGQETGSQFWNGLNIHMLIVLLEYLIVLEEAE